MTLGNAFMTGRFECSRYVLSLLSNSHIEIYVISSIALQEEVDDVVMLSLDEILIKAEDGKMPFTMDSIHACKLYVDRFGSPAPVGERPIVEFY